MMMKEVKRFAREKTDFENTIKGLQSENQQIKTKYDKLKAKHIDLLQTLLGLEGKNQKLENECQELRKSTQCKNLNAANSEPVLPCFEVDTLIEFLSVTHTATISPFNKPLSFRSPTTVLIAATTMEENNGEWLL